jgi:hypothetical protein
MVIAIQCYKPGIPMKTGIAVATDATDGGTWNLIDVDTGVLRQQD